MFRVELKKYRENAKLSQTRLAEIIGVSQATVGMWESGKREPNFATLCLLADCFKVSTDEMLGHIVAKKNTEALSASLPAKEAKLLDSFSSMNEEGQGKVQTYVEDLVRAGIYKNSGTTGMVSKNA